VNRKRLSHRSAAWVQMTGGSELLNLGAEGVKGRNLQGLGGENDSAKRGCEGQENGKSHSLQACNFRGKNKERNRGGKMASKSRKHNKNTKTKHGSKQKRGSYTGKLKHLVNWRTGRKLKPTMIHKALGHRAFPGVGDNPRDSGEIQNSSQTYSSGGKGGVAEGKFSKERTQGENALKNWTAARICERR